MPAYLYALRRQGFVEIAALLDQRQQRRGFLIADAKGFICVRREREKGGEQQRTAQ